MHFTHFETSVQIILFLFEYNLFKILFLSILIYSNKDTRGMCWIKNKGFNAIEDDLPRVEGTNLDAWVKYKWEKMRRLNLINK